MHPSANTKNANLNGSETIALASLWAINDKASSMLVTEFYRQLQDEQVTKAQALQRAQQKLMQNVRYRHPGYWSPFLLIGNWL